MDLEEPSTPYPEHAREEGRTVAREFFDTRAPGELPHGDASQGEAHVVHLAHVGSARLNLELARDLGVID